MINILLIANRGEIACRIIRTAKKMGISTIAVYSEADNHAMHTRMADKAICIGPPNAKESYLDGDKIIQVALSEKADAIHPGYGFLSENAQFVEQVEQAGIIFIGAPSKAIAEMGNKSTAKHIMAAAGVPLVPGYDCAKNNGQTLIQAAAKMEYPLLLKASAGGGGKGMRVVHNHKEFPEALASAQREASSSFGDAHMIIERYIETSRHVEVQVFFDQQGHGVYLFDRDCSLQRRYQKVIEEAPAPNLPESLHQTLGETALKAGKAVNYVGAGTVEFLVDSKNQFYFMEMNTRLQVEHPVTEMITDTDLVEWQIRVARGELLPVKQEQLKIKGHAFEARLYAEEPRKNFSPATGTLHYLTWPQKEDSLRIETGVCTDDTISSWYDPMIAKIVVWGKNRQKALEKLTSALQKTHIAGLPTNRDFLIRLAESPEVIQERMNTSLIEKDMEDLQCEDTLTLHTTLAAVTLSCHDLSYGTLPGWRLNGGTSAQSVWQVNQQDYHIKIIRASSLWQVWINGCAFNNIQAFAKTAHEGFTRLQLKVSESCDTTIDIVHHRSGITAISDRDTFLLTSPEYTTADQHNKTLSAPMNGVISSVNVSSGHTVNQGDTLLTLEAMKMEINIKAPKSGCIDKLFFAAGDTVKEGDILMDYVMEDA